MKLWYVYIMTNKKHWTLYVGVTSNLLQRVYQHREWVIEWFTKRYWLKLLVYYEQCPTIESAIIREKQFKWWNRTYKTELIESINKDWNDLYNTIIE